MKYLFTPICANIVNKCGFKVKKPVTQCFPPKSKNHILDDEKIQKAYKNPKLSAKKNCLNDLVIKQFNLLVFMTAHGKQKK